MTVSGFSLSIAWERLGGSTAGDRSGTWGGAGAAVGIRVTNGRVGIGVLSGLFLGIFLF
jgi:hypothetical protein